MAGNLSASPVGYISCSRRPPSDPKTPEADIWPHQRDCDRQLLPTKRYPLSDGVLAPKDNIFLPGAGIIYLCHRVFLSKVPRAVRPEVLSIKIRGDINKLCQTKGWKIFPIHAESQTAWQNQNAQILTLWEVSLGR